MTAKHPHLRGWTVSDIGRRLHLKPPAVREAIRGGLLWVAMFGKAIRVPGFEIERVRANSKRVAVGKEFTIPAAELRRILRRQRAASRSSPR